MFTNQAGRLFAMLLIACAFAACGKKGAPLPPLVRVPGPVGEPVAMRIDQEVYVRFTVPVANVDLYTPADIVRVEVYAITAERAPTALDDPEKLRKLSTLVATEQVRKPAPPLPPLKPGEPEPPPLPIGPGLDQGVVFVVRDRLDAAARVPVTLPSLERRGRKDVMLIEPLPGPLVAPLEDPEPLRYYYAVGVGPGDRYGPAQPFMPVPLGATSSAPDAPAVSYDEKTLTIAWTPAADARGIKPPPLPDVLPSTSVPPEPPPTTYDLYEVPQSPPANQTPVVPMSANQTLPAPLTPAPIAEVQLTQPVTTFGAERCFVVRPVDILQGYHVRGPASPTACVTLEDIFEPGAATSLRAVASGGAINLIWEPSAATDVAGYLVLRGEAPGATLTPLTTAPISETTFVDRNVRLGATYVYAVIAVDKAGNRSPESNRVEETARQ